MSEDKWVCVNGHDRCQEMYPGPECPYCEKRDNRKPRHSLTLARKAIGKEKAG